MGIVFSYFLFALGRPSISGLNGYTTEYYGLLSDAFLAGHTYLPIQPRQELLALPDPFDRNANGPYRLHDSTLYKGKYYLYFGPAPALILFVPYRILTGSPLTNRMAVPIFCMLGFLCAYGAFRKLADAANWKMPVWLELAMVAAIGCAPFLSFLLRRAIFYEVPIAAAYFLIMAGISATITALKRDQVSFWWLALGGLCFGLSAGCRPYLLLLALAMPVVIGLWLRSKAAVMACGIPVIICGALLAGYNYARFDNPFEVGVSYQLTGASNRGVHLRLKTFVRTIGELLFDHPTIDGSFPYIHPAWVYVYVGVQPPNHWDLEPSLGVLAASPIAALGLLGGFLLRVRRRQTDRGVRLTESVIGCLSIGAVMILIAIGLTGFLNGRYTVEFGTLLTLAGCLTAVSIWQEMEKATRWSPRLFQGALIALVLYSSVLYICLLTPKIELIRRYLSALQILR